MIKIGGIKGWMTIYSASLPLEESSLFDLTQIYGRQMLFIGLSIPLIFVILFIDAKVFEKLSFVSVKDWRNKGW